MPPLCEGKKMTGNIKGVMLASFIVALLIVVPPLIMVMTFEEYPKYCKLSILVPCIGVGDG
jgi:hypothetical protein